MVLSPWCVTCKINCEILDHLLLHCSVLEHYGVDRADFAWAFPERCEAVMTERPKGFGIAIISNKSSWICHLCVCVVKQFSASPRALVVKKKVAGFPTFFNSF